MSYSRSLDISSQITSEVIKKKTSRIPLENSPPGIVSEIPSLILYKKCFTDSFRIFTMKISQAFFNKFNLEVLKEVLLEIPEESSLLIFNIF